MSSIVSLHTADERNRSGSTLSIPADPAIEAAINAELDR